tara:strand:- start:259 stop:987 length:729 start_codon:yes stop_codon:yes gene_type:complete
MGRRAVIDDLVEQYGKYCSSFTFKFRDECSEGDIHKEGFINCYWNPTSKLVYMHVDKCGSTSVSTALRYSKTKFFSLEKMTREYEPDKLAQFLVEKNHIFFAITRDPVQRWISGLNEFICRFQPDMDWVIDQVKSKKYIFDEHTGPQTSFLRLCTDNNANLKLIKLDKLLSPKVNLFIKNNLCAEDLKTYEPFLIPHLRDSRDFDPNYKPLCAKIYQDYVESDREEFDKLYQGDYDLYAKGE